MRKILSSAEVGAALNVRQMEPLDVLKQMSSMLPRRWLAKDTIFTARTVDIDDSWLVSTWTYILDNGLLDLYRGTMPLLPILPPFEQNLFEAKYLVKLAAEVPVVFNIDSLPPKVVEALSHVNIFVLDATIMKPFLHREVFNQLLQQAGVMGLLNALMACHNTIGFSSVAKWNADIKVALCEYLLTILIDISSMTAQMRTALRALPIWIKYGVNDVTALKSSIRQVNVMSDILAENCKLPPIDVPASLFDESFIVVQREVHRKAFIKLGIAECTSGQFFVQNVIPKLRVQQVFPDEDIQWISSFVLNNFSQLEAFDERVADSLRDCFIFANGTGSIRCSASSLYNPDEPLLRAFLPDSLFPSSVVCSSPIHIYHLKKMGLLKEVSPGDVLNAAKAIQETQDVYLSEINSSPSQWQGTEEYKSLVCRSVALLKYLGTNVDRLLSVVDAEGLAQFQRGSKTHDSDDEVSQDAAEGKLLGGDWGVELRSLSWIPVLIDPPSNLSHAGLPWPSRIHSSPFAAPSQSSLMNQAWYCSCNMRLCNVEINSSVLIALFGWSKALPGRSIALQLISISDEYQKIASIQVPSHDKNRLRLIEAYDRMYPPLLAKLHDAYIRESDRQVDLWTGALTNRRVVWINTGLFIEPGKVAFQGLPNVRTEPFLFVASTYMSRYKDMLLDVGVKEAFGPADLASMTRELYVQYGSTKLALDQVDAVISVSHALFTLIHDAVTAEGASFVEDAYVQELGAIYLPDSNDVLQVARSLTYNDAPWIVNSLGARIKVLKMVHGRVGMAAAKTLGAKSLRELLFAGEDMICPSVDSLGALIEDEGLLEVINSISSFASNVGAKKIELIFDDSTYPKESLLHPGLGEMQGCALMVFLDSVALNSEQITRFITPLADKNYGAIVSAETQCKNLASVFAITDCLSILSGNDFFVFDPSGRYLLGDVGATESHAEADAVITSKAETVPVARRFRIDKSIDRSDNSADLLNNFADQFVPFTCLPNHIIGNLMQERCQKKGMLLRLPLRLSASPLSKFVPTIDEAQTVFGSFRSSMISTVLFSPFMSAFRLSHISNMLYKEQLDVRIVSDDGAKQQKLKLLQSTGWEKQGITKLLSKTYVPPELYCSMKVCIQINTYPWIKPNLYLAHVLEQYVSVSSAQNSLTTNMLTLEETWLVCSCMGFSPLRDLALSEPYSSAGFKPFVSLAMQILEPWQLASHCTPMDTGLYYCGGILAGQTGFPFHVDGPFVQAIAVSKQRNVNEEPKSTSRQSLSNFESVSRLALNWNTHIFINALERLFPNTLINLLKRPFMDPSVSSLESSVKLKTLAGVYKYWIFNARLTNIAKRAVESSKLISFLSKEALYLLPFGSMQSLDKVLLNTHLNSGILIDYLSDFVPIGRAPMQVGLDLIAHGVPVSDLSAARLRALMKKDAHSHSQKLTRLLADSNTKTVAYRVLQEVIAFVTRDLAEMKEEGEFEKRRLYRTLQGVPALLMSDFSIRSFPTVVSDQICIVNDMSYFRILPPQVLNRIVHPWVLKHSSLFSQSLFRNTMFISTFNASFIRDVLPSLFPPQWNRADAACWKSSDYAVSNIPMDLVLYALWNETLLKEKHEDLLLMKDWPTVPVLTQHHRVLVSATLLPYLLMSPPGPAQDESRRTLRLSLKQKQDQYHSVPEIVVVDEEQAQGWKWIQENADEITSLEEELTEVNLENVQVEIPLSASPAPTATVVHVDDAPQNYGTFKLSTFNVLMKAGFLFVDVGLLKSVPPGVTSLRSSEHVGKRIVEVAHKLTELNVMLLHGDKSITPLLSLDRLSFKERNLLLLEAHEAHRAVAFDGALVEKTKALPLFTNSANGLPVSLSEVSGQGIFWCEDSRVLQLIEQFSAPAAIAATEGTALQATKPVILVNDAQLREVYRWLQVVELTAVVAMSKFIVPVIDSMNSRMRQLLLKELAVRWPVYRADTALVGLLKTKQWVPLWRRDSPEAWLQEGLTAAECNETYRRVNQTISWTNHELLDSLEGDTITNYTAPPSMRLAEHHVLFTDLGMLQELDFETLLKIACDIQADAVEARRLTSELSTVEGEIALRKCIDRGRRILMYVLDSDRLLEITQSNPMHVKKLGQVHFVPLSHPERMEDGGFIVYKDDVGAYRELVPRSSGALCFTLLPILDQSLTPPTLLFSQLGIISSPQEDVIMRHLRSLIQCVSLDRWNAPFPIDKAFAAIFTYLHDHWQGISPSIKNALQTSPLIPIGSHLVPPNRIFFRLTEDLSPFMHELPRMFGAHESLLKQLKVREAPTLQDYISFTKELAQEMHGQVLNVNEMRAIGTISSTLCSLLEQQQTVDMSILQSQLHMPDEHCVLHPVQSMVLSDDDSLQAKTLDAMQRLHMFCLHSSLHILGDALRLPKLSDVVVERIDQTKIRVERSDTNELQSARSKISHSKLALFLKRLLSSQQRHSVMTTKRTLLHAEQHQLAVDIALSTLQLLFVSRLHTSFYLIDISSRRVLQELTGDSGDEPAVFLDKHANPIVLYVSIGSLNGYLHSLDMLLACGLCTLLGLSKEAIFPVAEFLKSLGDTGSSTEDIERMLGLRSVTGQGSECNRGVVGQELVDMDYSLAELRPFRVFSAGEIVAYGDIPDQQQAGQTLYYGKVVSVGEANEAGLRKVEVRTEAGTQKLLSTQIYSFKSARTGGRDVGSSSRGSSTPIASFKATGAIQAAVTGSAVSANSTVGQQPTQTLASDLTVERGDILQAVQSLLVRVGLPLQLDQQVRIALQFTTRLHLLMFIVVFLIEFNESRAGAGGDAEAGRRDPTG
ncbi:hypothetical protein EON64_00775 [archaeon]|nr:MAG: hypothetical protein EON64_00775 [archaeon]